MRATAIGVLVVVGIAFRADVLAAPAAPVDDATTRAKIYFTAGEAHFSLGEFARALEAYRKAYELRPLAPLLFNMAQCHRHLGELERAAFLLRRFLQSPSLSSVQRQQAEAVLRQVAAALEQRSPAASRPSTASGPASAPAAVRLMPGARLRPAPMALGPPRVSPASPQRTPLYKRWWLWALVGGAVVATATTIGVLAGRGDGLPSATLGRVDYR